MAETVGTVIIEMDLDASKIASSLNSVSDKATESAKKIEGVFANAFNIMSEEYKKVNAAWDKMCADMATTWEKFKEFFSKPIDLNFTILAGGCGVNF